MPLIIITGIPCSGKSHRARQICEDFKNRIDAQVSNREKRNVIVLPSHHAHLDPPQHEHDPEEAYTPPSQHLNPRDQIYNLASKEKIARAEEFSAINRALSKNTVVIADSPNYIKGFRYQLWCEAKAAGTRCAVVHVAAHEDECRQWNLERLQAWGWDPMEEEEKAEEEERVKRMGPKIGKDVMGDLMPESHTAIYGDKILVENGTTRSRSSSMGAVGSSDDEAEEKGSKNPRQRPAAAEDTMTLKSLYITDGTIEDTTKRPIPSTNPSNQDSITSPTTFIPPPSPKSSLPYTQKTLSSLLMRYEPPSPFTRWDTPLFTIPTSDTTPPFQAIWEAIFPPTTSSKPLSKKARALQLQQEQKQAKLLQSTGGPEQESSKPDANVVGVKQHAATLLPTAHNSNALQLLEHCTGDCVKAILASARAQDLTGTDVDAGERELRFSVSAEEAVNEVQATLTVPSGVVLSQPMLQRLRRKYTQIQRGGIAHGQGLVAAGTGKREDIVLGFVRFLEREWWEE